MLSACDSHHRHVAFKPVAVPQDESILHVYRPQKMTNAMYTPDLLLDGETRTEVRAGNKYMFRLEPGTHRVVLDTGSGFTGATALELTALAGSAYYLRVDTSLALQQGAAGYTPYARSFDLVAVEADQAIEQITECCTDRVGNTEGDTDREKREDDPGDKASVQDADSTPQGFSTDKTANPFSH